jgi:hopanoid-associated phosphorylase
MFRMTRILAVCGMTREADLLQKANVIAVVGGGVRSLLEERLRFETGNPIAGVISIGIAGALSPALKVGDCVVASEIVFDGGHCPADTEWAQRLSGAIAGAHFGSIAGADSMLTEPSQKRAVYDATHALAVDMESHIAAAFAMERGIPFAALRVVSDDASHALPPAVLKAMKPDGGIDVPAVMGSLMRNPLQLPALIRTARDSEIAFKALLRCLDRLGPRLMGPDLG